MYKLEFKNISKSFGNNKVLKNINIKIKENNIHGIIGENGAGKSTLMNILFGIYKQDKGQIFINKNEIKFNSPLDALKSKISMVHQHFQLINNFTVYENIILGNEKNLLLEKDFKNSQKKIKEISDKYNLKIDSNLKIKKLSLGQKQRVEILKTIFNDNEIIIFDEPTATLTPQEIKEFYRIIKKLKSENKTIILITHKLKEIKDLTDEISIIRKGIVVKKSKTKDITKKEISRLMIGDDINLKIKKEKKEIKSDILKVRNIKYKNIIKNLSFNVKEGEILGIIGIEGNGQSELIELILNIKKIEKGSIKLEDKKIDNLDPRLVIQRGVAHIPEDRFKYGIISDLSLEKNLIIMDYYKKNFSKNLFLKNKNISDFAKRTIRENNIKAQSEKMLVKNMSGGNQQKLVIARELKRENKLIIIANPTRGVDVGGILQIHKEILEQSKKGKAIILISYDLDEIINLSDNILIMNEGKSMGVLENKKLNINKIALLMMGEKNA